MTNRMSATEASRSFSALLSRVAAGETVEIERHGQVVARLGPPRKRRAMTGKELGELLDRLPKADPDFADDIESLRKVLLPPQDHWAS